MSKSELISSPGIFCLFYFQFCVNGIITYLVAQIRAESHLDFSLPQLEYLLVTQLPTVFQICSFSPPLWSMLVLMISITQDMLGYAFGNKLKLQ